jgi:TIR domain
MQQIIIFRTMKNLDILKKIAIVPLFLLLSGLLYFAIVVLPAGQFQMSGNMILAATFGSVVGVLLLFLIEWLQAKKTTAKAKKGAVSAFMSFNSVDTRFARQLSGSLRFHGIDVDITNRPNGVNLDDLRPTLDSFDIVIVILSRNHSNSKVLRYEVETAEALNKYIFCVQIDGISQPAFLNSTKIRFSNAQDAASDLISVSRSLRQQIESSNAFEPMPA